jgi:hypothetical protein
MKAIRLKIAATLAQQLCDDFACDFTELKVIN